MVDPLASLDPLATRRLIQIPGPNPIVRHGEAEEWDGECIEGGDIFKDYDDGREIYYLYYHGHSFAHRTGQWTRRGYRIGVATATQPLGPFVKSPHNPLLDLGPEGAWDDCHVACPCIMRRGPGKYIMWYSGMGNSGPAGAWHVGLATAPSPLGPWTKQAGNPVMRDFGYIGGVVLARGTYYMYNEHPIGSTANDYGPFSLATATDPAGPWQPWPGNPVLAPEGWGAWDDGGYSEAKVVYHDGVFHVFYGAAKEQAQRMRTLESIGYAFSRDGYHFTRHVDNPVAARGMNPNAASFSEVKCLFEPPFVYLYHTLRYLSSPHANGEDLGVQALATGAPFKLSMPVLHVDQLAAGASSELADCPPISLDHVGSLSLSLQCRYSAAASKAVVAHVLSSTDGFVYDTEDWQTFALPVAPGQVARATVDGKPGVRFVKVILENLDTACNVHDLDVTATIGG
jgi:hypothetical protein